jgi:hypothetical protein
MASARAVAEWRSDKEVEYSRDGFTTITTTEAMKNGVYPAWPTPVGQDACFDGGRICRRSTVLVKQQGAGL